jgi:hypothetical protein
MIWTYSKNVGMGLFILPARLVSIMRGCTIASCFRISGKQINIFSCLHIVGQIKSVLCQENGYVKQKEKLLLMQLLFSRQRHMQQTQSVLSRQPLDVVKTISSSFLPWLSGFLVILFTKSLFRKQIVFERALICLA